MCSDVCNEYIIYSNNVSFLYFFLNKTICTGVIVVCRIYIMNNVFFERVRLIIINTVIKFVPFVILIVSMFRGRVLFRFLLTGFNFFVCVFVVTTAFCAGCRGRRFPCAVAFLLSLTLGLEEDVEMER